MVGVEFWFRILAIPHVIVSLLEEVNPSRRSLHFFASVHLDEFLSFLRGPHRIYDQARRKIQGGRMGTWLINQGCPR